MLVVYVTIATLLRPAVHYCTSAFLDAFVLAPLDECRQTRLNKVHRTPQTVARYKQVLFHPHVDLWLFFEDWLWTQAYTKEGGCLRRWGLRQNVTTQRFHQGLLYPSI